MATSARLFEKMNAGFADLSIVTGANVFITAEYAKAVGLCERATHARLQKLLAKGKVQKVRTRRYGRVVPAWKYLGR